MQIAIKAFRKIYRKIRYNLLYKIARKRDDEFFNIKFLNILKQRYHEVSLNTLKDILYENIKTDKGNVGFFYLQDKEFASCLVASVSSSQKESIISNAENICRHEFDLLGSGLTNVSYFKKNDFPQKDAHKAEYLKNEYDYIKKKIRDKLSKITSIKEYKYELIDWQLDFKSGFRWDNKTWNKNIKYGEGNGADVKVPWELSRANHFLALGQAYYLTKDEKYCAEFIYQVTDWMISNPYEFGVNWVCTMDVAIRVCNWVFSLYLFLDSPLINEDFIFEFSKSLYFHGQHIKNNLEREFFSVKGNHYLSDITGLLYLSIYFKEFKFGRKWHDFAIKELKKEIKLQVYEDGCDFEASTYYHRLVMELFFFSTVSAIRDSIYFKENNWLEAGNKVFGYDYMVRLKKMFYFILYSIKPDGQLPQIGDNDNGRLHNLNNNYGDNLRDVSYLLNLGAVFFEEKDFIINEFKLSDEVNWVFNISKSSILKMSETKSLYYTKSKSFENAGWFILRNESNYMFISAGPNGQNGVGGHAHNDKLSFDFAHEGEDVFLDSGTFTYTSDFKQRNKFRSVYAHNTVVIDKEEQNRFKNDNIFYLKNDANVSINKWETSDKHDLLDAEHSGYKRLTQPVIHRRQFLFDKLKNLWIIKDTLMGKVGSHNIDIIFHLAPELEYEVDFKEASIKILQKNGKKLFFKLLDLGNYKRNTQIEDGFISESYGKKTGNKNIVYSIYNKKMPLEFIFIISEFEIKSEGMLKDYFNLLNYSI